MSKIYFQITIFEKIIKKSPPPRRLFWKISTSYPPEIVEITLKIPAKRRSSKIRFVML